MKHFRDETKSTSDFTESNFEEQKKQIADYQEATQAMHQSIENKNREIEELSKAATHLQKRVDELTETLRESRETLDETRKLSASQSDAIKEKEAEIIDLKKRLEISKNHNDTLKSTNDELREEIKRLGDIVKQSNTEIPKLDEESESALSTAAFDNFRKKETEITEGNLLTHFGIQIEETKPGFLWFALPKSKEENESQIKDALMNFDYQNNKNLSNFLIEITDFINSAKPGDENELSCGCAKIKVQQTQLINKK